MITLQASCCWTGRDCSCGSHVVWHSSGATDERRASKVNGPGETFAHTCHRSRWGRECNLKGCTKGPCGTEGPKSPHCCHALLWSNWCRKDWTHQGFGPALLWFGEQLVPCWGQFEVVHMHRGAHWKIMDIPKASRLNLVTYLIGHLYWSGVCLCVHLTMDTKNTSCIYKRLDYTVNMCEKLLMGLYDAFYKKDYVYFDSE